MKYTKEQLLEKQDKMINKVKSKIDEGKDIDFWKRELDQLESEIDLINIGEL